MYSGSTILACLLLAANAGAPEVPVTYWNARDFAIPLRIDRRDDVRDVLLYMSQNEGKDWKLLFQGPPDRDKESYSFTAPSDGVYCFGVAITNRQGKQEPAHVSQIAVAQKVIVDTTNPRIVLKAERREDKIVFKWEIDEVNPDKKSLKLEYKMAEGTTDQVYEIVIKRPDFRGEESFPAPSAGAIKLHLTLSDLAHNVGTGDAFVPAADVAPSPPPRGQLAGKWTSDGPGTGVGLQPVNVLRPPETPLPQPLPVTGPSPQAATTSLSQPIATERVPLGSVGGVRSGPNGSLPQVSVVRSMHVRVEFDVERCGPSGLGKADVYLSTDDGQHWECTQQEVPVLGGEGNPTPTAGAGQTRASVMVHVPKQEVIHGVYLIVKSGAGQGEAPPVAGQLPQMRVEVDTQAPMADLLQPLADPSRENGVILQWKAMDRNLEANPITLEYADSPAGPWKIIGSPALPNTGGDGVYSTGKFAWTIPYDLPNGRAYLRLTVRDQAGNVTLRVSCDAVLFDTIKPKIDHFRVGS